MMSTVPPLHSGCFMGTCAACAREPHPQSSSRLLVSVRPHVKRRLLLMGILANLREGKSVVYASSTEVDKAALRRELVAEGATTEELRRFTLWDPARED